MFLNIKARFFIILILIISIYSCENRGEAGGDTPKVTIAALKGPSAIGMIKMIDSLPQSESSGISIKILSEPLHARKMMIEKEADFAILPLNMAAAMYNKGLPYQLVAVLVSGSLYVVGEVEDVGVENFDWKSLKGKRVNVMAKGMTPDLLTRYLLVQNLIVPDYDVKFDYTFPSHTDLASALIAGRATFGVIAEPYLSMVMEKNQKIRPLIDLSSEWEKINGVTLAETALLVKSDIAEKEPKLVEEVLKSYDKSTLWVNNNPDSAAVMVVNHNIVPTIQAAKHSTSRLHLEFRRALQCREDIEKYLRVLYEMNPETIGGQMPDNNFYR